MPELPEVRVADIDRCIQTSMFEETFSAAACIAAVGPRIFHRAVYGTLVTPPPIQKLSFSTLFDLGALTQPLGSGLATMVLASQNRLDLNIGLNKTIPAFRDDRFSAVTLDMLLEHTSGFPSSRSYWQTLFDEDHKKPKKERVVGTSKTKELVLKMLAETRFDAEPGTKVLVSDLGYLALGFILEAVTGKPLDTFLSREIYRLLNIEQDMFFIRLEDTKHRERLAKRSFAATVDCPWRKKMLQAEVYDANAWMLGGVAGHAGLFATIDAVWKLIAALWSSYKGEGRDFLGGAVRRFWTRSKRLRDTTRTLAWDTPSVNAPACGKRFSKNSVGLTTPSGSAIWLDLSTDIIGIVLTNAAHPKLEGKEESLKKFVPKLFELIAKHGEAQPKDPGRKTGSAAFYSMPMAGTTIPLRNPLKGPSK